ncbi:hypothetical protein HYV44_02475 [Candidatus Microgenomates bacterium]|nr:hypothetical protein [Candidatus Microgenomates bacterium]
MSVLSKPEILKHYQAGNIIIDPFNEEDIANSSCDVRLGQYFYRQSRAHDTETLNPFWEESIAKMYPKVEQSIEVKKVRSKINPFFNLEDDDQVIFVAPGETILAHTTEFIGGKNGTKSLPALTTEMRARSSLGRIGIGVCKCAGWGDIGYVNRWTMEITNFSTIIIPLVVGMRIAQIIFHEVGKIEEKDEYAKRGKYHTHENIEAMKKNWKPEDMLPKLYKDRDIGQFKKFV